MYCTFRSLKRTGAENSIAARKMKSCSRPTLQKKSRFVHGLLAVYRPDEGKYYWYDEVIVTREWNMKLPDYLEYVSGGHHDWGRSSLLIQVPSPSARNTQSW
jgi:hypothetical protein